jgi:hypothetical protein
MKKAVRISLITLLLSGTALAQVVIVDHVPPAVKNAFQTKFPIVKYVQWKIKSDMNYEAEFTLRGTEIAVKFDSTGKWVETESAASRSAIPSAVHDTIAKRFKGYKIVEIQTVQRWNEQRVVWEIHLEDAKNIVKVQFGGDGAIISRSAKPKPGKKK